MVLFADDTSIIVTDTNLRDFNVNANQTFQDINTWYKVNFLTLTFMHHASYIQDRRTATPQSTLFIYLVNKYII